MCDRCMDLELENAALRAERDMLLQQREATKEWLQEALQGSPLHPVNTVAASQEELRSIAERLARMHPQQKIIAIKEMRTWGFASGWDMGLKDAKDWCDWAYESVNTATVNGPYQLPLPPLPPRRQLLAP